MESLKEKKINKEKKTVYIQFISSFTEIKIYYDNTNRIWI